MGAMNWPEDAKLIVAGLIGAEFNADRLPAQQIMCLTEEAGEFTGAYRRYLGWARRPGDLDAVRHEAADVVITARVTAAVFGWEWPEGGVSRFPASDIPAWAYVRRVADKVSVFAMEIEYDVMRGDRPQEINRWALDAVEAEVYRAAHAIGFDLDEAIREKLETVFARGWREAPADA